MQSYVMVLQVSFHYFMLYNLDIDVGVYITCFICFVQCTWFVLVKLRLANTWWFIVVFVLLLPKLSSNYLLYNLLFQIYKRDPTSGGWGDGN